MNFAENLKKYREEAGYVTAKDFAAVLNIPVSTYTSYENGTREPNFRRLDEIAAALHIAPAALLGITAKEDPIEERKKLIRRAGFQISEVSPPGCVTVMLDMPDFIRRHYPTMPEQMPVAFPQSDFIEWVDDAMAEYEAKTKTALHDAFYSALQEKLYSDMAGEILKKQKGEK